MSPAPASSDICLFPANSRTFQFSYPATQILPLATHPTYSDNRAYASRYSTAFLGPSIRQPLPSVTHSHLPQRCRVPLLARTRRRPYPENKTGIEPSSHTSHVGIPRWHPWTALGPFFSPLAFLILPLSAVVLFSPPCTAHGGHHDVHSPHKTNSVHHPLTAILQAARPFVVHICMPRIPHRLSISGPILSLHAFRPFSVLRQLLH